MAQVFCMVDGAKDWKPLSDKGRRGRVQRVIKDVFINTLMAVRGAYLCRYQEDEFKYMVAFPEPEVSGLRWARCAAWLGGALRARPFSPGSLLMQGLARLVAPVA